MNTTITKDVNTMTNTDFEALINEYQKYKRIKEESEKVAKELADQIQLEMTRREETESFVGPFKCTISTYDRTTFDSKTFAESHPRLFKQFSSVNKCTRFVVK